MAIMRSRILKTNKTLSSLYSKSENTNTDKESHHKETFEHIIPQLWRIFQAEPASKHVEDFRQWIKVLIARKHSQNT